MSEPRSTVVPRWPSIFTARERTDIPRTGWEPLATPPADPFAEDLVVVPARGVERWPSQRLSHVLGRGEGSDGVCAGWRSGRPDR